MADEEFDDLNEMLRKFLAGGSDFDMAAFAKAAGLPADPAALSALLAQLRSAISNGSEGISETMARDNATAVSGRGASSITDAERSALTSALNLAGLWVDEATQIPPLSSTPGLMTRPEWARAALPAWIAFSEPVATSISRAAERAVNEQIGEVDEHDGDPTLKGALPAMRRMTGTLFSMQLGQIVGQLSHDVVSGGDIGLPLVGGAADHDVRAVLIPQNVVAFATDLTVPAADVALYLAAREIAHARLFRHAKWLKSHIEAAITDYARGIHIDAERIAEALASIDPTNPAEIQRVVSDGSLIPPRTEEQRHALGRIETMLALIEGWVDTVTADATRRLPSSSAIAEMVRRRRAAGGPGEKALAGLVGLELRPRRLREAAALWRVITDAVGTEARDALWAHPDIVPTDADIDYPQGLLARLSANSGAVDDVEAELQAMLDNDGVEE
ncbi:putative hydrolase [Microbacteriaceae bacterium MWH-Ta3]|nr:putative hydrolase [Microbacteriaceae bacterium MWH-Ta3]